ncbi:serine protease inhibitor dipetalogastin-like [Argopecten irradians]|uniref:serine protease inhibitor dipetalogastin-like n=1 Tax=Argopecten irradians TaxID=31199 RepID=UPI00371EA2B1
MKLAFVLFAVCISVTMADEKACACQMKYKPVCGADGETYGNDCMRKCNDVRLLHKGKCEKDLCVCDMNFKPVCGDDGDTYINDCSMNCQGVNLAHDGECEK